MATDLPPLCCRDTMKQVVWVPVAAALTVAAVVRSASDVADPFAFFAPSVRVTAAERALPPRLVRTRAENPAPPGGGRLVITSALRHFQGARAVRIVRN